MLSVYVSTSMPGHFLNSFHTFTVTLQQIFQDSMPRHIYSKCYTDGQKTLSCQLHGVFASSDFTKILQVIRVVPMWYRGPVTKSRKDLAV